MERKRAEGDILVKGNGWYVEVPEECVRDVGLKEYDTFIWEWVPGNKNTVKMTFKTKSYGKERV